MDFLKLKQKKHKIWFAIVLGLILTGLLGFTVYTVKPFAGPETLTFPEFVAKLEAGQITKVQIEAGSSLRGSLSGTYSSGVEGDAEIAFTTPVLLPYQTDLNALLAEHGFPAIEQTAAGPPVPALVFVYLALFLAAGLFVGHTLGVVNLSPSTGHRLSSPRIRFTDVAGVDDAKDEIMEVVNLIKRRASITDLGGSIPKGLLLVGPPGTGKTMLAKAIATEAGIPFFEISGSSFVEKYVGTGAARVRSLFKKARKEAPCIVFIDEIDAVGGTRSDSGESAAREHNQTLNALLVEMDGASGRDGVVVVAATNRKDTLDSALLRPGRFDRTLDVALPDVRGREAILKVHGRKTKLDAEVDFAEIAKMTPGFSGADLASLLNEAALAAGRRGAASIGMDDLAVGRDRILLGVDRGSRLNEREKWLTACHEAGHTVVNFFMEHGQRLERVTIIPRGGALGVTLMVPEEMKYGETRLKLLDTICVLMGGRAAEEIFLGDVSSGASGDIAMATRYAKKMVCEWGMSDGIGMVRYESGNGECLSIQSAGKEIEAEVRAIISKQYDRALELLREHQDKVEQLARALVEHETLTESEVAALLTQRDS